MIRNGRVEAFLFFLSSNLRLLISLKYTVLIVGTFESYTVMREYKHVRDTQTDNKEQNEDQTSPVKKNRAGCSVPHL